MKDLKKLPIGVQTFARMRTENFVYVDKTEHIYNLATKGYTYFLSRPRRFGKSLTVSTLKELFEGNRTLFKGLWIEDKWDWSQTHPVIHISFAALKYKDIGLQKAIKLGLMDNVERLQLKVDTEAIGFGLDTVIRAAYSQYGSVVILIDEYDKPIIDFLTKDKIHQAKTNRDILKGFYAPLKDSEGNIRFLFITGVSKFSRVSIFSDLNHLDDITLDKNYATLVGYTQQELEATFEEHIEATRVALSMDKSSLLADMKEWYDGFSWDGQNRLYNPFCILNFFSKQEFSNYWFATATPTFLVNLIKERGQYKFEQERTDFLTLDKYDLDNLNLTPLLFQTGYLTIKEKDRTTGQIILDYPNREVRDGMYKALLNDITNPAYSSNSGVSVSDLSAAFRQNDLAKAELIMNTLFADLPHQLYESDPNDKRRELELSERFFHSIVHLIFKYMGLFIQSEVNTYWGRADAIVTTETHIYIFEFKYNRSPKAAFDQIIKKKYADTYRATGKTLVGIGVNFRHADRRASAWKVKVLDGANE